MRRRWTAGDPEPDDRPAVVDDIGHFWVYDRDGDDLVGGDEERNLPPGWFSPLVDARTCPWTDIFTYHNTEYLTEISEVELERMEADLLGWHAHYPGYEDPEPPPEVCTRCLGTGVTPWPHQNACPKCQP